MPLDLDRIYSATCASTLSSWALHADAGTRQPPPFHPTKLAITSGSYSPPTGTMASLIEDLVKLVEDDPLADAVEPANLHFTFLALSPHDYATVSDLPPVAEILSLFRSGCSGNHFSIQDLRLIALPNALLLAGRPTDESFALRTRFSERILASPWRSYLEARYPGRTIPPPFWHSTLLRYHAEYLPQPLRDFFTARQDERYGDVDLPIHLVAANYNWEIAFRMDK